MLKLVSILFNMIDPLVDIPKSTVLQNRLSVSILPPLPRMGTMNLGEHHMSSYSAQITLSRALCGCAAGGSIGNPSTDRAEGVGDGHCQCAGGRVLHLAALLIAIAVVDR